ADSAASAKCMTSQRRSVIPSAARAALARREQVEGPLPGRRFISSGWHLSRGGPVLVAVVLHERKYPADHCQSDEGKQRRLVVLREEPDDVAAIDRSQAGNDCETKSAAQGQRGHKLLAGILHRARRQQKRHNRKRRRQQGRHRHREKSPVFKTLETLAGFALRKP